jgi:hypothetical protein
VHDWTVDKNTGKLSKVQTAERDTFVNRWGFPKVLLVLALPVGSDRARVFRTEGVFRTEWEKGGHELTSLRIEKPF